MSPEEIQKINETIALKMGWTNLTWEKEYWVGSPPGYTNSTPLARIIPNPYTSMDDVFEAVNVICPGLYIFKLNRKFDNTYRVVLQIWPKGPALIGSTFSADAKTPEAAISLALVEYIKEKEPS